MPLPNTKQDLADWILRRLGAPVVNVEIADVQLEDVIDEAVQFFQEYHYDGAERSYRTLKISSDVIAGNNRIHQNINAPVYDASRDKKYRIGDRVMTHKQNRMPDRIWIRFDSDENVTYRHVTQDSDGEWFVKDSDISLIDFIHVFDSEARSHEDSDGVYVKYDSDIHNYFVYYPITTSQFYYSQQLDSYKPDSDSFVRDSDTGLYVPYDSDKHVIFVYDSDAAGLWVDSDGVKVLFDSDNPDHYETSYVLWDSDADTTYVLVDGQYVLYDSDTHGTYTYVQDSSSGYVREEGTDRYVLDSTDPVYQLPGVVKFKRITNAPTLYEQLLSQKQRYSRQNARPVNIYLQANELEYVDSDGGYVLYDSDKHFNYVEDSEGEYVIDSESNYVFFDSDLHTIRYVPDSDGNRVLVDSDYIQYDSERHTSFVYDSEDSGAWTLTSVGYELYDSDTHNTAVYDSDDTGLFVFVGGAPLNYDSDVHNTVVYDSDTSGAYVFVTGDPVLYDSDTHAGQYDRFRKYTLPVQRFVRNTHPAQRFVRYTTIMQRYRVENFAKETYESDASGEIGYWVYDENNDTYIPYDSELYSVVTYESDASGPYVDSDGVIKVYNSDTYAVYSLDSDWIRTDSDGNTSPRITTKEELEGLYVLFKTDSEDRFELYDSDKHISIFTDSDGFGQQVNFGFKLDTRVFKRALYFAPTQRFKKVTKTTLVQRYNLVYHPYVRYKKVQETERFYRRSEALGQRYSITNTKGVREIGSSFQDYWKEEDLVLTEPVVEYDYSKTGQVGIPVPDTIIGINKVFRIDNFSGMGMWNYEYQYFLNNFDFFYGNGGASSMAMTNYYTTKSYMELIDHMMNVQPAIRFNKHRNRLYLDTGWTRIDNMAKSKDYYLMIECYEVNDPEVFGDVYKDKWLKRYATSLAKMQWGTNLKKYQNTELPGGLVLSGQELYDEGKEEAEKLEEELKNSRLEMDFLMG